MISLRIFVFKIIVLSILSFVARSSVDKHVFISINDKNAISGGVITTLLQDHKDRIWIGTQSGFLSYDGYSFKSYQHIENDSNSLSGNYIRSMALSEDGRIWLGTLGNGLSIFDPATGLFENYKHNPEDVNSLSNNRIDSIATDKHGGAWLGTNNGLDYINPHTKKISHYLHDAENTASISDNHIRALIIDSKDALWVGSWKGLDKFDANSQSFIHITNKDASDISLIDKNVLKLFESSNGDIWFGTPEHGGGWIDVTLQTVNWLPLKNKEIQTEIKTISHPWITGIAELSNNIIWMATYGGGINVIDTLNKKVIKNIYHDPSIPNDIGTNEIGPILLDKSGLLWIGTWGQGLKHYNAKNQAFKMYRHSLSDKKSLSYANISSIMEANDGLIWVGTSGNGIDLLDLNQGVIGGFRPDSNKLNSLVDGFITALIQTQNNAVWVGTRQSGLHQFLPHNQSFKNYTTADGLINNYIHKLLAIDNHTLWVGTSAGLNRFDLNTKTFSTVSTSDNPNQPFIEQIDSLAVDSSGTLWIGAESGLYYLESHTRFLKSIKHDSHQSDSLAHNDVNGLLIDSKDQLWVSTNRDLQRLISHEKGTAHFQSSSMMSNNSFGLNGGNLLEDKNGNIWTSAFEMFNPNLWKTHNFGVPDGVDLGAGWIRSYAALSNNRLMYGGSNGLLLIEPDKFEAWEFEPKIIITDLHVNSKNKIHTEKLSLPENTKSISVEFSALDYSDPLNNLYSFRLDPYDIDWIKSSSDRRVATYTNLDPGKYQLRIRGSNRKGQWSSNQVAIEIIQKAAWYQTLLFKIGVVLLSLTFLYLLYLIRVTQLREAEKKLKIKVKERTIELKKALKTVELSSLTDPLTKLFNRRYFTNNINAMISSEKDNPDIISTSIFYMIDIDDFKSINDTYGHTAGDEFLIQFASLLKEAFEGSEMIVRWGGEEFIVVTKSQNEDNGATNAELIRKKVEKYPFDLGKGQIINKTCSIGFTAFPFTQSNQQLVSWEEIISITDIALYATKNSGKNGWLSISVESLSMTRPIINQLLTDAESVVFKHFKISSSFKKDVVINFRSNKLK